MIEYQVRVFDDGRQIWYLDGKLHRKDGPAIIDGDRKVWYYLNGESLSRKEFIKRTQSAKELSVGEISEILGYEVKVVK